jgi:membrane-associated phospholipid phosphatase
VARPAERSDGPLRATVERILRAGSSRGTAFPSSHVAVSVAQTLALWQLARGVAPALAPATTVATVLLAAGAVYGGFHYAVDVLAGALVGAVTGLAGRARTRG